MKKPVMILGPSRWWRHSPPAPGLASRVAKGGSQNKEIYGEQTQETTEKEMTKEAKSKKVAPKQGKERTVAGKRKMWPRNTGSAEWVTYQAYKKDGQIVYDGVLHEDTYEALKDEKGKPIPAKAVPIPVDP